MLEHKAEMVLASKSYRRTVNKYVNKHKKYFQSKLRQMQIKQPKDFWRLVNGLSKKKILSEINLNTLYEYFKTVNTTVCDETCDFINTDNDILDVAITEEEILCDVWKTAKHLVRTKL